MSTSRCASSWEGCSSSQGSRSRRNRRRNRSRGDRSRRHPPVLRRPLLNLVRSWHDGAVVLAGDETQALPLTDRNATELGVPPLERVAERTQASELSVERIAEIGEVRVEL